MGVIYLTQSNARLRLKTGPKEPVGDYKCVIPAFISSQHAVMSLSGQSMVVQQNAAVVADVFITC